MCRIYNFFWFNVGFLVGFMIKCIVYLFYFSSSISLKVAVVHTCLLGQWSLVPPVLKWVFVFLTWPSRPSQPEISIRKYSGKLRPHHPLSANCLVTIWDQRYILCSSQHLNGSFNFLYFTKCSVLFQGEYFTIDCSLFQRRRRSRGENYIQN